MSRYILHLVSGFSVILLTSCTKQSPGDSNHLFLILHSNQTGITFNNQLHESDSLNILTYLYYYNGGGVAIGDINNDGLPDIYFTGNDIGNKLYLNKGGMQFTDITQKAGVACNGAWSTGVSMVDVNGDGLLDIYVCQVDNIAHQKGRNQLFINNSDLTFRESAQEYGLDFSGLATHAAFLDFDRDGDLDCYLLNHSLKDPEQFKPAAMTRQSFDVVSGDRLLENKVGHYFDVSEKAGIFRSSIGFGLGIDVGDLNRDGWPDIYVGNDFHENDYLYINNQDGTFKEVIAKSTGHTSNFTMGVAIADINNDALPDILSLDMKPEDEMTYKLSGGWESFNIYQFKRSFGYHHQSPRNTLQINQGIESGIPVFSELACQYSIEATDWSWSPLLADFNGDGHKDIFISNGIERRPNDLDFVNYYSNENIINKNTGLKLISTMPDGEVSNYLYINSPDHNSFQRIIIPALETNITNGASYSDLDRDGDLDIICNNLNHPSYIIQNNNSISSYISLQLKDSDANTFGIGSQITLYQKEKIQYQYLHHLAGFQSGKELLVYFVTNEEPVDSIIIQWPDGNCQAIYQIKSGFQTIQKKDQVSAIPCDLPERNMESISLNIHHETTSTDFEREKWIPYSLSSFGPRIAIGKNFYYTTDAAKHGTLHQLSDDKDVTDLINNVPSHLNGLDENDAVFEDFNNDGFEDLFISIGGNILATGNGYYGNQLYFGHQDGSFHLSHDHLPKTDRNCSVARTCDYDVDGDIDIFVGTLSRPGNFGLSEPSCIYVNEGRGIFSIQDLPVNEMVFDAQWSDMDLDGLLDLIVIGHWMPITILYNRKTHWEKVTISNSEGLWFSIMITDLNQDSIPDIIAGNFGLNHPFEADTSHPLILYLNDFDQNGQSDPILTYMQDGKSYIYPNLELFLQQLPSRKKDFVFNKNFAGKQLTEIFTETQLDESTLKKCNYLASGVFLSDDNHKTWNFSPFPYSLQHSPVWSICKIDNERFAFGGNFYNIDPNWGRQDALFLTFMKYDKEKGWLTDEDSENNYLRRSEIRDLKMIKDQLYIASNNDTLISVSLKK